MRSAAAACFNSAALRSKRTKDNNFNLLDFLKAAPNL
jgi:hypothetical protein